MKSLIFYSCLIIVLFSFYTANAQSNCQCKDPQAYGKIQINLNGNMTTYSNPSQTITLCLPSSATNPAQPAYGSVWVWGEVHPGTIDQYKPASTINYFINGGALPFFSKPYHEGYPSNTYTTQLPLNGFIFGTNIISIKAKCAGQTTYCDIATFTIVITKKVCNITLTTKCCTNASGRNTGETKLLMSGTVNCGGGNEYLKVEKQSGTSWVQVGSLVHFISGSYTPCYPKAFANNSQTYRVTLVDNYGFPISNTGTVFPWIFGTYCVIPPR